jgi:hypothetical protein
MSKFLSRWFGQFNAVDKAHKRSHLKMQIKLKERGKSSKSWCIFVADISSEIQTKRELCFVESVFKWKMVILDDCVNHYFKSGGLETETVTLNINKLDLAKTAFFSQQYFYLCVLFELWNKTSWIIITGLFIISNYVSLLLEYVTRRANILIF